MRHEIELRYFKTSGGFSINRGDEWFACGGLVRHFWDWGDATTVWFVVDTEEVSGAVRITRSSDIIYLADVENEGWDVMSLEAYRWLDSIGIGPGQTYWWWVEVPCE